MSGELDVPFQTFAKLLNRLDTVVKDFIVYAFNDWQHGRYNEFLLAEYIRLNQFDDAKKLYETMKDQEFSSDVGRKLLPFSIMKMNYELGEITLAAFLNYGRSILWK